MKLHIVPRDPSRLHALAEALGGPGRPAGISAVEPSGSGLTLDFDQTVTGLRLIVDAIDAELEISPGREIHALEPLDDATLAAFAAATLNIAGLGPERLVETHLAPLLRAQGP